jgi:hypothetical protein
VRADAAVAYTGRKLLGQPALLIQSVFATNVLRGCYLRDWPCMCMAELG